MKKSERKKRTPKRVLRLPDLDFAKRSVLNTLGSPASKRAYEFGIDDFVAWYCSEPRLAFSRIVVLRYRLELESRRLAPSSINLRLAAARRLAYEAADTGLLSPELAAGIRRVKGAKRIGVRLGNWLTAEQSRALLRAPDTRRLKGRPHRKSIAIDQEARPNLLECLLPRRNASAHFPITPFRCRSGVKLQGVGEMAMRLLQLHVCFSLLVCGGALAQPQEPIPVLTVCEALNGLQEYNGRIEIVVGRASYTDEGSWLGAECGGAVVTEGFKWPDSISTSDPFSQFDPALEMPKTFHWNADTLVRKLAVVQKTTTLRKYSGNLSQYNDRWIAIFGRLETRVPLAIWTYPSGERRGIGFGHLGSAPARLVYCAMCYREIKPTRRSK